MFLLIEEVPVSEERKGDMERSKTEMDLKFGLGKITKKKRSVKGTTGVTKKENVAEIQKYILTLAHINFTLRLIKEETNKEED